ncbi:protein FAM136A isoform X1 [Enhydra lutris kenyoni]|uniref:Protein FAM136A n=2 Tax=Caniformia TaxID=379584 RepID=A0A2Y9JGE3_ENHLU|nr:protein FAM136A isoform X1 [Enhydra lutris kenyoni]
MAEMQQLRVQEAVDSMVKSLERENIRKMQVAGGGQAGESRQSSIPLAAAARRCPPLRRPESGRPWGCRRALGSTSHPQKSWSFRRVDEICVPSPRAKLFSPQASSGEGVLDPGPVLESPWCEAFGAFPPHLSLSLSLSALRPQGLMFRCSASCCEDSQASMQQVHQCIERCHAPLAQAQALVTSELEKFQDRLARCTMHCNDKAKDSIDAGSKELQVKRQLESCVTKCVDDHMHLIPTMTKKMKESLLSIGK